MEPFIGEIRLWASNFNPRGWAFCHGALLQIASNTALFSLFGTTYGGDGRVTFGLPDLRGRVAIQQGSGPGLSAYRLGQRGGVQSIALNATQIPAHTHTVTNTANLRAAGGDGTTGTADGAALAHAARGNSVPLIYNSNTPTIALKSGGLSTGPVVANTGASAAHENMQPWLGLNYIVALTGVYPSRN